MTEAKLEKKIYRVVGKTTIRWSRRVRACGPNEACRIAEDITNDQMEGMADDFEVTADIAEED